jgi:hypothetical protein
MPKVSNQISWKIFLSDYHVFTSRFAVKEREGEMRKKAKTLCELYCRRSWVVRWDVRDGWHVRGRGSFTENERKNNNFQLKRGKLSLYIFLIFCVARKRENRVYRSSSSSSHAQQKKTRERDFPIKCACVCLSEKSLYYWKEGCQNMSVYVKPYLRDYYYIPLLVQCCECLVRKGYCKVISSSVCFCFHYYIFFFSLRFSLLSSEVNEFHITSLKCLLLLHHPSTSPSLVTTLWANDLKICTLLNLTFNLDFKWIKIFT